ncbi:HEAT repeat domain-containing protein [Tessaracoccus sp. MC1865]|uniref:HEAT repeat domain-containing protein n=1 Tax=Tessaracoccus sp. MC1865 TaxID=2760310 RepID=UPI0015FF21B5|nr:HEAT repeat domain-containing protein [Tessaracoccus sp. MC1865]MBB1484005.1 HEAT repeat domain-containing protein [Tessaracoccus sp. MC1865]QTO37049.1 HEAT repeat domain-containing protein [Tessaracoccus sp. MC1865]
MTRNAQTLINQLDSPVGTDRRMAALALGSIKDPAVVPALLAHLKTETDGRVREDLTWAVVQHADEANDEILAMLQSDSEHVRFTGAHVVSKVGNPEHFEHVRGLVADPHKDVALKAYRAAANTGGHLAAGDLAARLGDGDDWQRDALSDAFRKLGQGGVAALVARLTDESTAVREHAAEALGYVGGPEADGAAEALEQATADEDADVRLAAVSALGQLGYASDEALARVAEGDDRSLAAVAGRFLEERVHNPS